MATVALVLARRYEPARLTAALAVAAIVAGWALAQQPRLLPRLTVEQAAAPRDTLVAVLVAIAVGAVVLFPSLALLFRLVLGGRLGPGAAAPAPLGTDRAVLGASRRGLIGRGAVACLVAGTGFLNIADAGWAHAVGVVALAGFVVLGFFAAVPALVTSPRDEPAG
jgi:cytochrome d ubiquinol oxidase subunit II